MAAPELSSQEPPTEPDEFIFKRPRSSTASSAAAPATSTSPSKDGTNTVVAQLPEASSSQGGGTSAGHQGEPPATGKGEGEEGGPPLASEGPTASPAARAASAAVTANVVSMISHEDVAAMYSLQLKIMQRMHTSNVTLATFNEYSGSQYATLSRDLHRHRELLRDMGADLDYIFKKIKVLKQKAERRSGRR